MKKLILSVSAIAGLSMSSFSQGVIYFDGSNNTSTSPTATSEGSVFIAGVLDTTTDINAQLLYSSTLGGTYAPVVTLSLASANNTPAFGGTGAAAGDITFWGSGVLQDTTGSAYQIPLIGAGVTAYFEVSGNVTINSKVYSGITGPFSEVLTSATGQANDIQNMPALNLVTSAVPEPSTLAMAGVGLASMLIFRRKNK